MEILGTDLDQTEAILNLQLGRLTKLDVNEITVKIQKAEEEVRRATELIENNSARIPLIKENLKQMSKMFGDERRTTIEIGSSEESKKEEVPESMSTIISDGRLVNIKVEDFEQVWKRGNEYARFTPIN
jgi:DNA gyrase subunit A